MRLPISRKVYLYLVPAILFLVLLVVLSQLRFLDLGAQALLVVLGLYVVTQISLFLSSFFEARRSQRRRLVFHRAVERLSLILRMPKLLPDAPRSREQTAEEISTGILFETLDASEITDLACFVHFTISGRTFSHSLAHGVKQPFLDEVVAHYRQRTTSTPVLWSNHSVLGTLTSKNPQAEPMVKVEGPLSHTGEYERAVSAHDPGRQFCLVFPLVFHVHTRERTGQAPHLAYVGFLSDSFIDPTLSANLSTLIDHYQSLYSRIRSEQTSLLLDDIQNRDVLTGATVRATEIGRSFCDQLRPVLLRSFEADAVEIWIRGLQPDPSESIFSIVSKIASSSDGLLGVNAVSPVGNHRFGLDTGLALENCALGFIRILRDSLPFSPLEVDLLRQVAQIIDNYVRDLWVQQVVRTIDEEVLNVAPPRLETFLELFIATVVRQFDAAAGGVVVSGHARRTHVAPGGGDADLAARVETSLERLASGSPASVRKRNGYYELEMRISVASEETLGAIYVVGVNELTGLHHKILKIIESHVDNIIKLYLALERPPSRAQASGESG